MSTRLERPIIFNKEMVKAILEGRKTQTRRPLKVQPPVGTLDVKPWCISHEMEILGKVAKWETPQYRESGVPLWISTETGGTHREYGCPFGDVGDRLWVRETYALAETYDKKSGADLPGTLEGTTHFYRDGGGHCFETVLRGKWRPSIHMPRWASRITLEVLKIRAERLQDITGHDVIAEGFEFHPVLHYSKAMQEFTDTWGSIYGDKPGLDFKSNPWVWVVEFINIKMVGPIRDR
jgi:hypothetical protein